MELTARVMALDRDIFWIGHQWAVTGVGLQAIDDRHAGRFDIPPSELWEASALEKLRGQNWIKADDFAKALLAAREHYAALRPGAPPIEVEPEPDPNPEPETPSAAQEPVAASPALPEPKPVAPAAPQRPSARLMARFVGSWRVRVR